VPSALSLDTPSIDRIALYEPPLSVHDSVPMAWTTRFDREIAAGKISSALVTVLKDLDVEPFLGRLPRFVPGGGRAARVLPGGR
jgi:hypothetical protein